jgi:ribonuclease HII
MGFTESVALALLERAREGLWPRSADELLGALFADVDARLKTCCPNAHTAEQCWSVDLELPAFGGDVGFGRSLLDRLVGRSHLRFVDVQSRVACAGVLNARLSAGRNKLDVDLELFEDLIDDMRRRHEASLLVVCGMIGGIRDYASRFRYEADAVHPLTCTRGQRRYAVDGVGEVRFEVDADARHLPVALASIVGKYVREICMRRIGEFYRRGDPALRLASGYHDPVTTRFIQATELSRRRLGIATDCFRRQA